jgi:hypothetical protein
MNNYLKIGIISVLFMFSSSAMSMQQDELAEGQIKDQLLGFYGLIFGKITLDTYCKDDKYILKLFTLIREMGKMTQEGVDVNLKPLEDLVFENHPNRKNLSDSTIESKKEIIVEVKKPAKKRIVYPLSNVIAVGITGLVVGGALTWLASSFFK